MPIQILKEPQGNYVRNWSVHTQQRGLTTTRGGNDAIQAYDTPTTRRQRASHGAKPPLLPTRRAPEDPECLAAVPVGGGGAWPGFETTRRAKLAARTARGRAAAHGHTEQPGPTAGPSGARNTSGTARPRGHAKGAGTAVPAPCRLTQPLPRRGSGRMILSPGDGDASTGTYRPRRPLPGPPHRSDRRSPCAQDAEPHRYSGPWPEPRARRTRSSRR